MSARTKASPATRAIRRYLLLSAVTVGVLTIGAGGWAATSKLSGAVIGAGTIVVEGSVKKIQHREGGIIKEIRVRDGMKVEAGDLLVRLDDTVIRATLAAVVKEINQLDARRIRLLAERDNSPEMIIPDAFKSRLGDPQVAENLNAERSLFTARRQLGDGQRDQLRQQIQQISQEKAGILVKLKAKDEEMSWISQELERVTALREQGLVQFTRLSELKRVKAQLDGERGQMMSDDARAAMKVGEIEMQILQIDKDRRAEVLTDLLDIDSRLSKLTEQRTTAEDQLKRIDIVSPQQGIVHQLAFHTIGGVVAPGEALMEIVPNNDALVIEAHIKPTDIDQVHAGQDAGLRFSAFSQRTTQEIDGKVETVSPDLSHNQQTGESWYTARITIPADQRALLGNLVLVAGMPVETFIRSEERTALSYLVKPLADQVRRAMQEE